MQKCRLLKDAEENWFYPPLKRTKLPGRCEKGGSCHGELRQMPSERRGSRASRRTNHSSGAKPLLRTRDTTGTLHADSCSEKDDRGAAIGGKKYLSCELMSKVTNSKDHIFLDVKLLPGFFTKRVSQPVRADAILDFVLASIKDIKKSWWCRITLD